MDNLVIVNVPLAIIASINEPLASTKLIAGTVDAIARTVDATTKSLSDPNSSWPQSMD